MDAQTFLEQSQLQPGRHTWWARVPFAVTALVGGLILIVLKAWGMPQWSVTVLAVLFMLGYAATVAWVPILRLREDQLADNCYYLGFLYTLISLSWALWQFTKNGSESDIVANFGLALASTIVGVLLRVTINQARRDVLETEQDARMELAQSVIRLRVQIDDAVLALSSFHRQTEQTARDAILNAAERAAAALDGGIAKVGDASAGVMARIEEAFGEFTENAQQLNAASAGTVRGLKALLTRIEKIEAPNDIVLKRLEPALAAAAAVTERLRERLEADSRMLEEADAKSRGIADRFEAAIGNLGEVQKSLALAAEQSRATVQTAEGTTEQFQKLLALTKDAIDKQVLLAEGARAHDQEADAAVKAHLAALAEIFKGYNDTMAVELERCRRMVAGTGGALASLVESINERLDAPKGPPALAPLHFDRRE
jgi:hypothetical protein